MPGSHESVVADHGGHTEMLARTLGISPEDLLDFSSNTDILVAHLTAKIAASIDPVLHRYPDPECVDLREAIAQYEPAQRDEVLCLSGSSEGIFLALAGLRPTKACIVAPIFSEYVRACHSLDIPSQLHVLDPGQDFRLTEQDVSALAATDADLIVICAPCNPTGAALSNLARLLPGLGKRTLLVDGTYHEFVHATEHHAPLSFQELKQAMPPGSRLLMLRSFTKWAACPGVRLGYALGDPGLLAELSRLQPPWSVTQFAQNLGQALLNRIGDFRDSRAPLHELRGNMARALAQCPAIAHVVPSDLNFFLCRLRSGVSSQAVARELLAQHMVVRVCDNIPGLDNGGYVRIQIRTRQDNERVTNALVGIGLDQVR
ncbi:MAG: aminotransferase class I/II-fold pyridoxal phosphate-dependent enzyme [Desulfovibrio sp.]|nr:MAG: aminotransferase class I/II-fold pyridoxal phosphate-dependent enzyme [Desulfovibrio sp.]